MRCRTYKYTVSIISTSKMHINITNMPLGTNQPEQCHGYPSYHLNTTSKRMANATCTRVTMLHVIPSRQIQSASGSEVQSKNSEGVYAINDKEMVPTLTKQAQSNKTTPLHLSCCYLHTLNGTRSMSTTRRPCMMPRKKECTKH